MTTLHDRALEAARLDERRRACSSSNASAVRRPARPRRAPGRGRTRGRSRACSRGPRRAGRAKQSSQSFHSGPSGPLMTLCRCASPWSGCIGSGEPLDARAHVVAGVPQQRGVAGVERPVGGQAARGSDPPRRARRAAAARRRSRAASSWHSRSRRPASRASSGRSPSSTYVQKLSASPSCSCGPGGSSPLGATTGAPAAASRLAIATSRSSHASPGRKVDVTVVTRATTGRRAQQDEQVARIAQDLAARRSAGRGARRRRARRRALCASSADAVTARRAGAPGPTRRSTRRRTRAAGRCPAGRG